MPPAGLPDGRCRGILGQMRHLLLTAVSLGLLACGGDDMFLRPQEDLDQPALDTATRTEPDRTWDSGVIARDIRWNYNFATPLPNSISVVGSFRLRLVNTNLERDIEAGFLLRFVASDGERLVAQTPLTRVTLRADSLLSLRENFILEVKDNAAANAIERMALSLF